MAARGIGAGVHQGNMDREKLALQRESLNTEAQLSRDRMAQQDEQFKLNLGADERKEAAASSRFDVGRKDRKDELGMENSRYDKQDARLDRQEAQGSEDRLWQRERQVEQDAVAKQGIQFNQKRAVKSDAWSEIANMQALEKQQQEMEQNGMVLDAYRTANRETEEAKAQRKAVSESHLGALLTSTMENGGMASPKALSVFKGATGRAINKLYFLRDGSAIVEEAGEDGKPVQNFLPQDMVNTVSDKFNGVVSGGRGGSSRGYGSSGGSSSTLSQDKFDLGRAENALRGLTRIIDDGVKQLEVMQEGTEKNELVERIKKNRSAFERIYKSAYGDLLGEDEDKPKTGLRVLSAANGFK